MGYLRHGCTRLSNSLPRVHVLECDTGSCISTYYYLVTHRDPYAIVGSNPSYFYLVLLQIHRVRRWSYKKRASTI
jgi:hypothetical protein